MRLFCRRPLSRVRLAALDLGHCKVSGSTVRSGVWFLNHDLATLGEEEARGLVVVVLDVIIIA